jgi:hypothetical protein
LPWLSVPETFPRTLVTLTLPTAASSDPAGRAVGGARTGVDHLDCRVDVHERDGFVEATLRGIRTPETLVAAAATVTSACTNFKNTNVLIDLRAMIGELDTLQTFEVVSHAMPKTPGTRQLTRAAVLDLPGNMERLRFFETVAVNRGFNVRVFDDEQCALAWLRG